MKDLLRAINRAIANLFSPSIIFKDIATGEPANPYIVFTHTGSTLDQYSTCSLVKNYITDHNIQIQVISDSDTEALDMLQTIIDYLHEGNIEPDKHDVISVWLVSQDIFRDPDNRPDGKPVYIATVIFDYKLSRTAEGA